MTISQEYQRRLTAAVRFADEAGRLTLDYFQTDRFDVERKSDDSPVTVADRGAEQRLRERIVAEFAADGIIGEEFGEQTGQSGFRWILDPIDGTKSFISGVPLYGTMVAVEHEGRGVVGAVYIPGLDEMIFAATGQGAWYRRGSAEPTPARVSTRSSLADGLFITSQVDSFDKRGAADAFAELQRRAYITRTWGDCYGYLLVATGRAEVMVDPIMNVWDAAAVQPIMEEAGGSFTDWNGNATIHSGEGIGTNRLVLEEVLAITRAKS
ncbi:MAG: histidinol-phosphatase [Planctomycetales bacterium]|nr:histidinol-phosphatase [Planctomycetales bacterium]MCA9219313.1 histidinol-phosphatase [Planctomycetales bacterium]